MLLTTTATFCVGLGLTEIPALIISVRPAVTPVSDLCQRPVFLFFSPLPLDIGTRLLIHFMIRSPKPSNPPIFDLRRVGFPTSFGVVSPAVIDSNRERMGEGSWRSIVGSRTCVFLRRQGLLCCRAARGRWRYKGETQFITGRGFSDPCGLSIVP